MGYQLADLDKIGYQFDRRMGEDPFSLQGGQVRVASYALSRRGMREGVHLGERPLSEPASAGRKLLLKPLPYGARITKDEAKIECRGPPALLGILP